MLNSELKQEHLLELRDRFHVCQMVLHTYWLSADAFVVPYCCIALVKCNPYNNLGEGVRNNNIQVLMGIHLPSFFIIALKTVTLRLQLDMGR